MAQFVDKTCLAIALVLPALAVLRWNLLGMVLGTVVFWGTIYMAGPLLSALDPKRLEGGTFMLDLIWLVFGWIPGVVYCLLIYWLKRGVLSRWSHIERSP